MNKEIIKKLKKNKREILKFAAIVIGFLILLAVINFYVAPRMNVTKEAEYKIAGLKSNQTTSKVILTVNKDLISYLEKQQFIKDLPESREIVLQLYSFENEKRKLDSVYTITGGKVIARSSSKPDITVVIASKYLKDINDNLDLCSVIKEANKNGDFGYEINIDNFALIVRYSGMLGYKECLE